MNLKKVYRILILFLTIIIFYSLFVAFTTSPEKFEDNLISNELINNCEVRLIDTLNFLKGENLNYFVKYEFVNVFPEYQNINCVGKVKKIDDRGESFIVIYTYINNLLKNILYLIIPLIVILLIKLSSFDKGMMNIILIYGFMFSTLLIKYLTYSFLDIKLITLYLFIFYLVNISKKENNFNELLVKFFLLILIITYSSDFSDILSDNEYGYIGEVFASESEYSSYISSYNNSFLWKYLLIFLKQISSTFYVNLLNLIIILFTFSTLLKFFKQFRINIFAGTLSIFIFFINNQAILGGDTMFGRIEHRSVSYLFLLNSLIFASQHKISFSYLMYVLCFFFHFGVAIVNFPLFIFLVLYQNKLSNSLVTGLPYFLITLPYGLSIYNRGNSASFSNVEYYIRNRSPHHLLPFSKDSGMVFNFSTFEWLYGFIQLSTLFVLVIVLRMVFKQNNLLFEMSLVSGVTIFLYLLISYLFPINKFILLHPFRIVSLFTLFSFIFIINLIITNLLNSSVLKSKFLVPLFVLIAVTNLFTKDDMKYYYSNLSEYSGVHAINFVRSQEPSIFITPTKSYKSFWAGFEYRTGIPTYVIEKFTPNNLDGMTLYLERLEAVENFYKGECESLSKLSDFYFVDKVNNNSCGSIVYEEKNFNIYTYP